MHLNFISTWIKILIGYMDFKVYKFVVDIITIAEVKWLIKNYNVTHAEHFHWKQKHIRDIIRP